MHTGIKLCGLTYELLLVTLVTVLT